MPRGQVKWFDPKKGYGFIVGPEGQDVFVHYSHILSEGFKSLKDGQWVDYELLQGDKGWQARSVHAEAEEATSEELGPTDQPAPASRPRSSGYEGAPSDSGGSAASPPRAGGYEGADD